MINKKRLINDIESEIRISIKSKDEAVKKLIGQLMNIIDKQPEAKKWMPCDNELPNCSGYYLTTNKFFLEEPIAELQAIDCTYITRFDTKTGCWEARSEVIAWQPLPEPYREK